MCLTCVCLDTDCQFELCWKKHVQHVKLHTQCAQTKTNTNFQKLILNYDKREMHDVTEKLRPTILVRCLVASVLRTHLLQQAKPFMLPLNN